MTNLTTFNFKSNEIRVVEIDDEPWFVATDVCRVLDLNNVTNAVRQLEVSEVRNVGRSNLNLNKGSFPNRGANCVSESGLYALIMNSRKPEAKQFRTWVTGTVLPSIRKNGGYISGQEKIATGEMTREELVAKALLVAENIRLEAEERAVRHFT